MRMKKWNRFDSALATSMASINCSIVFVFISVCLYSSTTIEPVLGKSLEPILWSLQNKLFSSESSGANGSGTTATTIEVRIGEFLNILCPKYSLEESSSSIEFHALHRVSKQEFDDCKIRDINARHPILKCDRPFETVKYTLYIAKFSPVPDAIEFTPGNSYYFISTSNGSFSGLNNDANGSCKTNNMKLIVKVLDPKAVGTKSTTKETRHRSKAASASITTTTSTHQSVLSDESNTPRIPVINLSTQKQQVDQDREQEQQYRDVQQNELNPTLFEHQQTTKTVNIENNDNIFILEPDSDSPIDYGDILSQLIFSSSHSPLFSTASPSLYLPADAASSSTRNSDMTPEDARISSSSSSSDEQIANFAPCYYFYSSIQSVFIHVFVVFAIFIHYYY